MSSVSVSATFFCTKGGIAVSSVSVSATFFCTETLQILVCSQNKPIQRSVRLSLSLSLSLSRAAVHVLLVLAALNIFLKTAMTPRPPVLPFFPPGGCPSPLR